MTKGNLFLKEFKSLVLSIILAFFIVTLLNTKVFAMVQVQQSSMEDTLYSGDRMFVDKITYSFNEPKRGDIIIFLEDDIKEKFVDDIKIFFKDIFNSENVSKRMVKRVIALPGDEIDIKDRSVYINDEKISEDYIKGDTLKRELNLPTKVPEGKLFVLGDNREKSRDSRNFGFIDLKAVEGKARLRVWPFNKLSLLK
ncbi:signal peptidase I [Clostridium sp. MSJ-4]|uniref:Signal peptidase I n=1 Tax=Clostridium simiarum TaxID=2841506 RepID=A0ABS6F0K8_9CLOT|nr:signal peptidase I [Clostridium simiarum]MBU5592018.1 signal peptidase I [Clostridium simiarum]